MKRGLFTTRKSNSRPSPAATSGSGFGPRSKSGDDAEAYASELVRADIVGTNGDVVFNKVRGDFEAAKVAQTDAQLRHKLNDLFAQALDAVKAG